MQPLRSTRSLARFVLAWFALVVAVAAGTPFVRPQALDFVCSGGGMKLVLPSDGDEGQPRPAANFDCALCLAVAPPPPASAVTMRAVAIAAPQPLPASRLPWRPAFAPPARGPPSLSA